MKPSRVHVLRALVSLLILAPAGLSQPPSPQIGYLLPAGGRQGTTFQARIGGRFLEGSNLVLFSGNGIQARVVEYFKPLTQRQFQDLRDRLQKLQGQNRDDQVRKEIAEIRKKLATFVRKPNPVLAETLTLEITIAAGAALGKHDLRVKTAAGLSNPLVFHVDQLPEFSKKESAGGSVLPARPALLRNLEARRTPPATQVNVTLPVILNGQILPGEVERYRFRASKGQQLVAMARARELIPYLADAVPGWFQAILTLYDDQGNDVAFADRFFFHPDPVLFYRVPRDGEYVLEVRDSIYRGREDFVYRIALGELPFVSSVFPMGSRTGTQTSVELRGLNLPADKVVLDTREKQPGLSNLPSGGGGKPTNPIVVALDTLPESLEQEPNNVPGEAQPVNLPNILNGSIALAGDCDVFRFEGKAGQVIVAEVQARKLGSPVDSVLKLTDASGRQLAFNDDHEDRGEGLSTHHADSWLQATLPAGGTYFLHVSDAQHQGGPSYGYRLRLSEPRPDFELRVVPSSINVRPGTSVPLSVYLLRRDGFSQAIDLFLKGAPAGVTLGGARVPAGQEMVRVTLSVPASARESLGEIHLEGRAKVQGRTLVRAAVPADDRMQAFIYRHLVPAQDWLLAVGGLARARGGPLQWAAKEPVRIPSGGTVAVPFQAPRGPLANQVHFVLNEPPGGLSILKVATSRNGPALILKAEAAKAKPGLKGNLIVEAFIDRPLGKPGKPNKPAKPGASRPGTSLGVLPALPFEVIPE